MLKKRYQDGGQVDAASNYGRRQSPLTKRELKSAAKSDHLGPAGKAYVEDQRVKAAPKPGDTGEGLVEDAAMRLRSRNREIEKATGYKDGGRIKKAKGYGVKRKATC